jgi:hypothetical protein
MKASRAQPICLGRRSFCAQAELVFIHRSGSADSQFLLGRDLASRAAKPLLFTGLGIEKTLRTDRGGKD